MRVWKNDRGITLVELLVSVVLLAILVIPITSIGTTAYKWYKQDQMANDAMLVAQQVMEDAKQNVEQGTTPVLTQTIRSCTANVDLQSNFQNLTNLTKITVTVSYRDQTDQKSKTKSYSTVVRKRGTP